MEGMLTEAQQKKMKADRQKKNEQKELDNLLRVFEWCGPLPAALSPTLCSRVSGDVTRMDKKGDKKLDADELLQMMKELGCVDR